MALIAQIVLLALVAQAAEPTGTLTLACQGTEITDKGTKTTKGLPVDVINIGIIVDFQNKTGRWA